MNKQRGFTLVELMIASLLGLVVVGGMANLFITANRSVSLSDGISQNQETGRFAMDYMTRFIRNAGYTDDFFINIPALLTTNGTFSCTASADTVNACSINDASTGDVVGDRLAIRFVVSAGQVQASCTGTQLGDINAATSESFASVFWVNRAQQLMCRTLNVATNTWFGAAAPIINHIERLEFQVGLADVLRDGKSRDAARYVNFDRIQADTSYKLLDDIRSIRIAILTTSQDSLNNNKIQTKKEERKYGLLDAIPETFDDGRLRSIFSNTIELVNAIEG